MKKMLLLSFVSMFLVISCTQDETALDANLNSKILTDVSFVSDNSKDPGDIIDITIGIKAYECNGWGICIIREGDELGPPPRAMANTNTIKSKYDVVNGRVQFVLELEKPSKFNLNEYPLIMSDDIHVKMPNGTSQVFGMGSYEFNPDLGKFGGYQIQSGR